MDGSAHTVLGDVANVVVQTPDLWLGLTPALVDKMVRDLWMQNSTPTAIIKHFAKWGGFIMTYHETGFHKSALGTGGFECSFTYQGTLVKHVVHV